jgi:hypothetical protein
MKKILSYYRFLKRTGVGTFPGISPIGESPLYFRQYFSRNFAIGECPIGESLIGERPATLIMVQRMGRV